MESARYLPPLMAENLESATTVELIREHVAILLAEMLDSPSGEKEVHSKFVERTIGARHYSEYLRVMAIFCDRDERYMPYKENPELSRCKVWKLKHFWRGEHRRQPWWTWVPVFVSRCLARMLAAWRWFRDVWLVRLHGCDVADAVSDSLGVVDLPEVVEYEMGSLCDGDVDRSDANLRLLNLLRDSLDPDAVLFDAGGRCYHALSNVKRECRLKITLAGEDVAELDAHASFVHGIAHEFARGDEKRRLLDMLAGGDFYGEFAKLAGVDGLDRQAVKVLFQRDVVFIFKPHNQLWDAWRRLFPNTAHAMCRRRDWGEVVKVTRKLNCNGRPYNAHTRRGQVAMSRTLSRLESDCFLKGALLDLARQGIPAVPIHDCLIVRERDVEAARKAILAAWRRRCGFDVVLKTKRWDDAYRRGVDVQTMCEADVE